MLLSPAWPPPLTAQVRPRKGEYGTRKDFLKITNLEEAGPIPFISWDPVGQGRAGPGRGWGRGAWRGPGPGAISVLRSIFIAMTTVAMLSGVFQVLMLYVGFLIPQDNLSR